MNSVDKIAKLLRADKDDIQKISDRLSDITDKENVLDKILKENDKKISDRLDRLGLSRDASAEEVYEALFDRVEEDSKNFSEYFGDPSFDDREAYNEVLELTKEKTAASETGFFLKEERAREFLKKEPPTNVMDYLGYTDVEKMLKEEDLFEIYSSLRFIEDREWMNEKFFKQYDDLTPDDFEEREIRVQILDEKWVDAAQGFVKKKWHNVSHLKELGFIFIIPYSLDLPGELLRTLGLVSHYLHEVPFYSEMFEKIVDVPETFDEGVASLLRGDVIDRKMPENNKSLWLVVQRYLVKDDPNDWRLFVPHLNPEGYHYLGAEEALIKMGEEIEEGDKDLSFWRDTDWVGDFFEDESGNDVRISFDLMDNAFGLVRKEEKKRFNYHQHEALWNKIFVEYFDREKLYNFSKAYLLQGYFEI